MIADPVPAYSALVIDDDPGLRQSLRLCLESDAARVLGVGTPCGALEALDRSRFDVAFLDLWLGDESGLDLLPELVRRQPGIGIIVITAFATFETAVQAMRFGAVDYLPKPFTPEQVRHAVHRVVESRGLKQRVSELEQQLEETDIGASFESSSSTYRGFMQAARRVADAECVVLLQGESGTGKNVLARWIRVNSARARAPFVTVNCPALSAELMSSVLFGHKRGAFTGAIADAAGKVQEAEGGTLFLDEVGDLTPDAQARLLRFLNDRTYERLGDAKERRADVRLIAATNRPLDEEVRAGRFREDLLFRLNVVALTVPPLRERIEDALPLAHHYLREIGGRARRETLTFAPQAEQAILAHPWPGNLRELRNAIERAIILAPSAVITPFDLGLENAPSDGLPRMSGSAVLLGAEVTLEEIEREHIARIIARTTTLDAAARTLGIDPTTLQRKRKRYGLA